MSGCPLELEEEHLLVAHATRPAKDANTGVVEAYSMATCADLPNTTAMYFGRIQIDQGNPSWDDVYNVTNEACGEYDGYTYCNNDVGWWLSYTDPDGTAPTCSYGDVSRQTVFGYPDTVLSWEP
jgi:hypothetical protein